MSVPGRSRRQIHGAFRQAAATVLVALAACGGAGDDVDSARADSIARARQDSINRAQPGYVVDSILPVEEELRRFRAGLDTVRALDGGASSREALVAAFVQALARADTAALARLAVTRAEYAWLVYPGSPHTKAPYRQAPGLAWMRTSAPSATGLGRLLARLGGQPLAYESHACPTPPAIEAENRIWNDCTVRIGVGTRAPSELRLFGAIIAREGRFKFLSFGNDF